MPKLTVEGFGVFEVPKGKRLLNPMIVNAVLINCMHAVVSDDAQPAVLNSYQVSQKPSPKQKKTSLRHEASLQHLDFVCHVKSHAMRTWK